MFGVAPRSSRISLKVPVSSGRSENTRHTRPPLMMGRSLPYRAVKESTACPGVETIGGGATGGVTAETGGWVNGAGRLGADAGPEGGARLMAPPDGTSGTDAGGTGGGRSRDSRAKGRLGNPSP